MRIFRVFTTIAIVCMLSFFPGCNRATSTKLKVAFVTNNPESFWNIAEAGCKKAEAEFGVELYFRRPTGQEDQKKIIDDLIGQNIKAMAISVIEPKGQRPYLDEIAAKVPLITQDNDAPESKRLCYIGTNNYVAGREVGKLVKECMPEGGTIAIFVGQLEPLNARQRQRGVLDELADKPTPAGLDDIQRGPDAETYGKYRLHRTYTDQVSVQRAKENAADCLLQLAQEKNLCMIGLWAYNPPQILNAVRDVKREGQVKIVGFDEDFETLGGIEKGHVHATVVQDPFGFGYESVKLMAALAKGDKSGLPKDGLMYVPHRTITKDGGQGRIGVVKFRDDLNALLGKK